MTHHRSLVTVDSHTAGEPTRVVVGGLLGLPGDTLHEKSTALSKSYDELRVLLTGEPRGHAAMHAVLPLPTCDPRADFSLLILSALGSQPMCGHALIGAVTVLIETGAIDAVEPTTALTVETLAGLIEVEAHIAAGRVTGVTFANAPSWVLQRDVDLYVPDLGNVRVDIAFGGLWYAIVDASYVNLDLVPPNVPHLVALSQRIRSVLRRRLGEFSSHPHAPDKIESLLFVSTSNDSSTHGRNLATSSQLGFDRSPCGTGSSARMALLHDRGELPLGQTFTHESILGTRFEGQLIREVTMGNHLAVVPTITGTAFITGFNRLVAYADDPLGVGFFLSPTGNMAESLEEVV
jgi:proline racemase